MEKWLSDKVKSTLIPVISDFIEIPNQSREFDEEWATNGLQERACKFAMDFADKQELKGFSMELVEEKDKPPVILGIVEPFAGSGTMTENLSKTILMYGHIDKQPPLNGQWSEGLGPFTPVIKNGRLYGRGGADDGYAWFSCVMLAKALQVQNFPHNRLVFFFECDEESGSRDLMYYMNKLKTKIGSPSLIFCLDSGTIDYDHFCLTTTLRGYINFTLRVDVMTQGVHSGSSSGVIPSSYRILRKILDDFEDANTGNLPLEFYPDIPGEKYKQSYELIEALGGEIDYMFPKVEGLEQVGKTGFQNYMNRIWKPQLSVTGIDGLPSCSTAGNVLLPYTKITCSIRLAPSTDGSKIKEFVEDYFSKVDVPYNAKFSCDINSFGTGFECPAYSESLLKSLTRVGEETFKKPVLFYGEGGSIPFLNDIKSVFPEAQFIVTGVLGPEANAHGPDEMLELTYLEKLVIAMAKVLKDCPTCL